jgi:long-subunit fatty acid transport protein
LEVRLGRVSATVLGVAALALGRTSSRAETVVVNTPAGRVRVEVSHFDPGGNLIAPAPPVAGEFRPPVIFSAPLPSGSGARALGLAGAFTAVADDATAASWNPAGLVQLERPEASFVWRFSRERNDHYSADPDYRVGGDGFDNLALNYLSAVVPFRLLDRNMVFSANYQEAYDFKQRFHADVSDALRSTVHDDSTATYPSTQVDYFIRDIKPYYNGRTWEFGWSLVRVFSYMATHKLTSLNQLLESGAVTDLEFDQQGVIDAITPALAFEATPRLSFGGALNVYQDDLFGGQSIESRTVARYAGDSSSDIALHDSWVTAGRYRYNVLTFYPPSLGVVPNPMLLPAPGQPRGGRITPFVDEETTTSSQAVRYEGTYEEANRFDDLEGMNATLGGLWTVNAKLSLGLSLDLPWEADALQTRTVTQTVTTYDASGRRVMDVASSTQTEAKDVTFDFPLRWAAGGVWRWNNRFYTTLDASETRWSDFAFQAAGEEKVNPLDGTPHGMNPIDDCWSARCGAEYLCVLKNTEIPLRAGFGWEQRPAVGAPDNYWGVSAGTGVSLGKDPGKLIVDLAYSYTWAGGALGSLVPGQTDLTTDVARHEVYLSCIWHF